MDKKLSDIRIRACDGKDYHAHSVVLYGQSALIDRAIDDAEKVTQTSFNAEFATESTELYQSTIFITLRGFTWDEIDIAMGFFYTSEFSPDWPEKVTPQMVFEVYRLAVQFEALGLLAAVRKYFTDKVEEELDELMAAARTLYSSSYLEDPDTEELQGIIVDTLVADFSQLKDDERLFQDLENFAALWRDVALALHARTENTSNGSTT